MCSLEYLPVELLVSIFHFLKTSDLIKCSHVNKKWQYIVIQFFIKPQLVVFTKLNMELKKSFYQEGWDETNNDNDLIVKLWTKYQPHKPRILITAGLTYGDGQMQEIINLEDDSEDDFNGYNYNNSFETENEVSSTNCENEVQSNPILSITCGGHGCVGGIIDGNIAIYGGYTDSALQEGIILTENQNSQMKSYEDSEH